MMIEEDMEDSKWQTETISLMPGRTWAKNTGTIAYLTHCSFAVPIDSSSSYFAVLSAESWDESITLCTLYPKDSSKKLKIVWGPMQSVFLMNRGNRELTMVILTRRITI
jgi:hypothetical protein